MEPLSGANTIPSSTGAAITATTETALFPAAQIAIPATQIRPGQTWELRAGGIYTIGATGTLTITPRYGTSIGGVTLGASVAQTALVYNVTAGAWFLDACMECMSLSWQTGLHASFICTGVFRGAGVAATAGSQNTILFGGTAATGDPTLGGLCIGWTLSVAGSITPLWQFLRAVN